MLRCLGAAALTICVAISVNAADAPRGPAAHLDPATVTSYGCEVNDAATYNVVDREGKAVPAAMGWKVEFWAKHGGAIKDWGMTPNQVFKSRKAALKECDRWMSEVEKLIRQGVKK